MGVKTSYKQTEVGAIPEDWAVMSIGQIARIKTGPFGTLLKASEYSSEGVPVVSVGEIRQGYLRISDNTPRVSEVVTKRLPQYVLKTGDIVFGRKGGVDRSAHIRKEEEGWFLGSDGIAIRADEVHQPEFLAFQFQTSTVKSWLLQNSTGTTMPSLNQGVLSRVQIPIPSAIQEQQAITEALSDADALIESLEQLLAKKRHIKQGAMQELLTGKKRLPKFMSNQQCKQTETGMIPGDWEVSTVGAEFSIQLGKMLDAEKNVGVPKPFIGNRAVQWGRIDLSGIGEINLTHSDLKRFRLRDGDLLVCEGGEVGRAAIWRQPIEECYYQKALHRLRPTSGYDVDLMLYFLQRLASIGILLNFVTQTSIAHLPKDKFQVVPIAVPPTKAEQEAIVEVLRDMDKEIVTLETRLAKAGQLKMGMMQQLLTGRIRLI